MGLKKTQRKQASESLTASASRRAAVERSIQLAKERTGTWERSSKSTASNRSHRKTYDEHEHQKGRY